MLNTDFSMGYGDIRLNVGALTRLAAFHVSSNKDNYRQ
jgi:hypothetical protein